VNSTVTLLVRLPGIPFRLLEVRDVRSRLAQGDTVGSHIRSYALLYAKLINRLSWEYSGVAHAHHNWHSLYKTREHCVCHCSHHVVPLPRGVACPLGCALVVCRYHPEALAATPIAAY